LFQFWPFAIFSLSASQFSTAEFYIQNTYLKYFQKSNAQLLAVLSPLLLKHYSPLILLTYTHSSKHDGKVFFAIVHHIFGFLHQARLATYLSCNLGKRTFQSICTFDANTETAV